MHIQILLTMSSLPMPMTNITTNTFMKMDNTAIRFLDVVYFLGMAVKIKLLWSYVLLNYIRIDYTESNNEFQFSISQPGYALGVWICGCSLFYGKNSGPQNPRVSIVLKASKSTGAKGDVPKIYWFLHLLDCNAFPAGVFVYQFCFFVKQSDWLKNAWTLGIHIFGIGCCVPTKKIWLNQLCTLFIYLSISIYSIYSFIYLLYLLNLFRCLLS